MSDTAPATPELETQPEDGPNFVHFVDARCWGCGRVSVAWIPEDFTEYRREPWRRGSTFWNDCHACDGAEPHDIAGFLTAVNREDPRANVHEPNVETDGST